MLAIAAGLAAAAVILGWPRAKSVAFTLKALQASSVALVGDFNDWTPTRLARNAAGSWEIRVELRPRAVQLCLCGRRVSMGAGSGGAAECRGRLRISPTRS